MSKIDKATTAPKQTLKVALCQMTSTEDVGKNLAQILDHVSEAPKDTDLAVFPENALFLRLGKESVVPRMHLDDVCFERLQNLVEERKIKVLVGSAPIDEGFERPSNAMVYLGPGQAPEVVYRKIHLFDVDVKGAPSVRESDTFLHGETPQMLEIKGWRIGLSICYDLRFAELYSIYAKQGAHVMFVPSAFLVPTGQAHWHVLLRARAIENQTYVLAPAQGGEHRSERGDKRHTYGHSLAVDPWGEIMADLDAAGPKMQIVELEPEKLEKVWRQIPQVQHRRLR
jgi:deaminated glutathione amidase